MKKPCLIFRLPAIVSRNSQPLRQRKHAWNLRHPKLTFGYRFVFWMTVLFTVLDTAMGYLVYDEGLVADSVFHFLVFTPWLHFSVDNITAPSFRFIFTIGAIYGGATLALGIVCALLIVAGLLIWDKIKALRQSFQYGTFYEKLKHE